MRELDDALGNARLNMPMPTDRLFPNEFKKMFNGILDGCKTEI